MAPAEIYIRYDDARPEFLPGGHIKGQLVIFTKKVRYLNGILLEWKGSCKICTDEYDSKKKIKQCESYYCESKPLLTKDSIIEKRYDNLYHLSFVYDLPPGIPPSFKGKHGYVRHTLNVIMKNPKNVIYFEKMFDFPVVSNINLNSFEMVNQPIEFEDIKVLRDNRSFISYSLKIPHSGYIPRQMLPFEAGYENSTKKSKKLSIRLCQDVTYENEDGEKGEDHRDVCVMTFKANPMSSGTWKDKMEIPSDLPPSGLSGCSHISIQYRIKFKCHMGGWFSRDLKKSEVLYIGGRGPVAGGGIDNGDSTSANDEGKNAVTSSQTLPEGGRSAVLMGMSPLRPSRSIL